MGNPDTKIEKQDGITPEMAEKMSELKKKDEEMNLLMGLRGEKRKKFVVKTTKERGSGLVIEENLDDQREKDYEDFQKRRAKELGKPIDRLEKYSKYEIVVDNYRKRKKKKEKESTNESSIEEIAEILKNNKIDQIIIAGEKGPGPEVLKKNPESTEKIFNLKPDLDAYTALYILNNFNKKTPEETFSETSVISVIEKSGVGKDKIEKKKEGIIIYLDTGGKWPTVKIKENKEETEEGGKIIALYIDHHGAGKREPTSGTKMTLEIMEKAGILKDIPPWFKKFTTFVNNIDNLSYIEGKDDKGRKIFIENYFRNEWPNSLYALAEKKIPFKTLIELCESRKIKDPSKSFTTEELNGELGSFKIGEFTIKELCEQQRGEVKDVLENGIKNRIKNNEKQGLNLNSKILGKIVYQDYSKNYGKIDMIPNHLAFKATKAKGFDTYISWNKQKKIFYINSFNPNLSKIVEELNKVDPECAIDVRGVMVYGKIKNLTEEQFLDIIDPNILKDQEQEENEKKTQSKKTVTVRKVVKKIDTEPQKINNVKEVTEEEISKRANEIYLKRQQEGKDGNEKTDWEEVEKQLREEGVKDLKLGGKIAGDKEVKGKKQKQLSPEEIKKMEELEIKKSDAEKKLDKNRENYIKEYKKCKTEADRQKLIEKTRTTTFNILAGVKNIFSKNKIEYKKSIKPEDYFTDKTREAKTEYTQARIEMGNIMFEQKKAELENAGLSGKDLETALTQYKATEILAKTITDERQKIIDSKTVEKPALWKRLLDGYMKIKPKWKRVALSTLLFLPLSASGAIGASAIAAGGIYAGVAGLAIVKFTASMAIGAGIGHLSKGIDLAKRKSDKEFSENQNKLHQEARDDFANNKIGVEEYEERTKNLEEIEKKRARDRMILKGVTGGALAMIAGFVAYDAMGNGIEHIGGAHNTIDAVSGPDVNHVQAGPNIENPTMAPPIIQHANIEATADNGQGGIALAHELKENLKVEYGDNLENAPASVKHALSVSDQDLAKELGMYKPGQEMESANLMEGDKIVVDGKTGEFRFDSIRSDKDAILQHGTEAEPSGSYEGKMFDSDHSSVKIEETPHNTPISTNEYKVPEQVDPITGEPIINTPHYEPTNLLNDEYKVPEQVDPITGQPIVQEGGEVDNQTISGKSEIKHINTGTNLSTEELHQVEVTVNENIDHLFPDNEHTYAWENVKDKSPDDLFKLEKEGGLNEMYKPLTSYIHKLEEVTGLHPKEASLINPEPETIIHSINRMTEEAQRIGKIDEVKL